MSSFQWELFDEDSLSQLNVTRCVKWFKETKQYKRIDLLNYMEANYSSEMSAYTDNKISKQSTSVLKCEWHLVETVFKKAIISFRNDAMRRENKIAPNELYKHYAALLRDRFSQDELKRIVGHYYLIRRCFNNKNSYNVGKLLIKLIKDTILYEYVCYSGDRCKQFKSTGLVLKNAKSSMLLIGEFANDDNVDKRFIEVMSIHLSDVSSFQVNEEFKLKGMYFGNNIALGTPFSTALYLRKSNSQILDTEVLAAHKKDGFCKNKIFKNTSFANRLPDIVDALEFKFDHDFGCISHQ